MEFVPFIIIFTALIITLLMALHVFKECEFSFRENEHHPYQKDEEKKEESLNIVSLAEVRKLKEVRELLVRRLEIDKEASTLVEAKLKARDLMFWTRDVNEKLGRD